MSTLVDRTREYSLRVIRPYSALPRNRVALVIGDQLFETEELIAIFVTLIKKWRKQ